MIDYSTILYIAGASLWFAFTYHDKKGYWHSSLVDMKKPVYGWFLYIGYCLMFWHVSIFVYLFFKAVAYMFEEVK
jgi:hypothetical protein